MSRSAHRLEHRNQIYLQSCSMSSRACFGPGIESRCKVAPYPVSCERARERDLESGGHNERAWDRRLPHLRSRRSINNLR